MTPDTIGWIGSLFFAFCAVPQAYKCYQDKNADGLSSPYLVMWLLGEVCYIASVLMKFGFVDWMMVNYVMNIICVVVIGYWKLLPVRSDK